MEDVRSTVTMSIEIRSTEAWAEAPARMAQKSLPTARTALGKLTIVESLKGARWEPSLDGATETTKEMWRCLRGEKPVMPCGGGAWMRLMAMAASGDGSEANSHSAAIGLRLDLCQLTERTTCATAMRRAVPTSVIQCTRGGAVAHRDQVPGVLTVRPMWIAMGTSSRRASTSMARR